MKYKWREIKRLDTLETDLKKLKNLRELPEAFKEAIAKYEVNNETIEVLEKPIKEFIEYKSVLDHYKDTNFLTNLYEEIKCICMNVKLLLRKDIEREDRDSKEFFKIAQYLIKLEVDKDDIRKVFCNFKIQKLKKRIENIKNLTPITDEVDWKVQKMLIEVHGKNLKESHYLSDANSNEEAKDDKRTSDLAAEEAKILTKFDKKEITEEIKERQTINITNLKYSQLKKGTITWFIKIFSEKLVDFIIETITEYKELFSSEGKQMKQFLTNFLNIYLTNQKEILSAKYISYYQMTECLSTVYNDAIKIGKEIKNIKMFSITDRVCEIAESTIRTQLINSMKKLYKKTADHLRLFSFECKQVFQNDKQLKRSEQKAELMRLAEQTYDVLMVECSITIGEARPLVKYQEQFLGGNNAFISLIHNQIVEYFDVFAEMIKVNLEKSAILKETNEFKEKIQPETTEVDESEARKIKGLANQSLSEIEIVPLNSMTILGVISICMKIEEMGMNKVISIVNDLVYAEETNNSNNMVGSVELWSNFELEKVPIIKQNLKSLLKHCNKFYVLYISKFMNERLRKYIKKFTVYYEEEPVLISNEIVEIFQRFKLEWKNLDLLYPDSNLSISPYATIAYPELLEKSKKHGSMMLEMDMFSSRKKKVFSGLGLDRYSVFLSLALCLFKSLYERIRKIKLSVKAFEQMHADIYFMFKAMLQFCRMEELSTLNGLINQVMSSAINRCEDHKHLDILIVNNMVKTAQTKIDRKSLVKV